MRQLVQLQKASAKLKEAGIQVVGISYDSVEILKKFADRNKVEFPVLSDAKSRVIEEYGVLNQQVRKGSPQEGIPHPCTFVIDQKGTIRVKIPGTVVKRHGVEELLDAAKKLKETP